LSTSSGLLKKIVHANISFSASYKQCCTAEFIEACEGLRASDWYTDCVKAASAAAIPLPLQDFMVDLHLREMEGIGWRRPQDTRSQTGYLSCMNGLAS